MPDPTLLAWPPAGLSPTTADRAVELLRAHLARPDDPAHVGDQDAAGVAAAVGAEQLACHQREGLGQQVDDALAWFAAGGQGHPPRVDEIVATTCTTAVEQVGVGLRTSERGRPAVAMSINTDAGVYAVVTDAGLLRAGVRAGETSRRHAPYYDLRYGSRGRRFTASDSAWLLTLADLNPDVAVAQVTWLAGLLAERGMPSWLLEVHLEALAEEVDALGEVSRSRALADLAATVATRRRSVVGDEALEAAEEDLARATARRWDCTVEAAADRAPVPGAGALVAAAVADAMTGLTGDIDPCVGWLADPERFDAGWCDAVRALAEQVRSGG